MAGILLKNLTKRFGKVVAVDNLTLEVKDGEFIAILGPSGSGKTTTLYLISGVYRPTSGEIYFGDINVTKLPPHHRNVGLVFQSYALYPHMTIFENIAFPLRLKKAPENTIKEKVMKVARMLQIDMLLDRRPHQLSGGQQQRVALARALVKEPQILLLDEPLSNLDAKLRVMTRGEIKRLQKNLGITAILVTHDQVEAMTMADRIAVIHNGRLQQYSTPFDLYNHPENIFVAGFIGSPPMNFVNVEFSSEDGEYILRTEGMKIKVPEEKVKSARAEIPKNVIMGIRPEDVVVGEKKEGWEEVEGEIYVTEPLGRETLVTIAIGDTRISGISREPAWAIGEKIKIYLNPAKIHLFDPTTERALF